MQIMDRRILKVKSTIILFQLNVFDEKKTPVTMKGEASNPGIIW